MTDAYTTYLMFLGLIVHWGIWGIGLGVSLNYIVFGIKNDKKKR